MSFGIIARTSESSSEWAVWYQNNCKLIKTISGSCRVRICLLYTESGKVTQNKYKDKFRISFGIWQSLIRVKISRIDKLKSWKVWKKPNTKLRRNESKMVILIEVFLSSTKLISSILATLATTTWFNNILSFSSERQSWTSLATYAYVNDAGSWITTPFWLKKDLNKNILSVFFEECFGFHFRLKRIQFLHSRTAEIEDPTFCW